MNIERFVNACDVCAQHFDSYVMLVSGYHIETLVANVTSRKIPWPPFRIRKSWELEMRTQNENEVIFRLVERYSHSISYGKGNRGIDCE